MALAASLAVTWLNRNHSGLAPGAEAPSAAAAAKQALLVLALAVETFLLAREAARLRAAAGSDALSALHKL